MKNKPGTFWKGGSMARGSGGGRHTVMTPETLVKIDQAFALGCSDEETCFYANISMATLYNYQSAHPEFLEKKNRLKQKPILQARQAVVGSFEKDPAIALKFLERKKREEFEPSSRVSIEESARLDETLSHLRRISHDPAGDKAGRA